MAGSADVVPDGGPRHRPLLLVVDPDPQAGELTDALAGALDVRLCTTAAEGLLVAGGTRPDVVLAAASLEDVPCPTVVDLLRRESALPVVVSADGEHADLVGAALRAGATACIPVPYRPDEVLAMVRVLGPRSAVPAQPVVRCGPLVLDPAARTVSLRGALIDLAPREFRLLHFLMTRQGAVVSGQELWEAVWGGTDRAASNTVSVHIRRLRQRLGDDPRHPAMLTTVGRSGYRLQPETRREMREVPRGESSTRAS